MPAAIDRCCLAAPFWNLVDRARCHHAYKYFDNGLPCTELCKLTTCTNQAVNESLGESFEEEDTDIDDEWN